MRTWSLESTLPFAGWPGEAADRGGEGTWRPRLCAVHGVRHVCKVAEQGGGMSGRGRQGAESRERERERERERGAVLRGSQERAKTNTDKKQYAVPCVSSTPSLLHWEQLGQPQLEGKPCASRWGGRERAWRDSGPYDRVGDAGEKRVLQGAGRCGTQRCSICFPTAESFDCGSRWDREREKERERKREREEEKTKGLTYFRPVLHGHILVSRSALRQEHPLLPCSLSFFLRPSLRPLRLLLRPPSALPVVTCLPDKLSAADS